MSRDTSRTAYGVRPRLATARADPSRALRDLLNQVADRGFIVGWRIVVDELDRGRVPMRAVNHPMPQTSNDPPAQHDVRSVAEIQTEFVNRAGRKRDR